MDKAVAMNDQPSWRKPAGMLMIMVLITAWALIIVALSPWIERLPFVLEMLVYLVAGIIWIFPLKPLLRWMETGQWR
jgi:predicted membrane channel-forming protein YqfA (hemolysin III family)